jgi:AcrR family transcriptional regulator
MPIKLQVVNTVVYGCRMTSRLTAHDWLKQGLKTLAQSGPEGLKAELLAKSLGVSRGSFYWHFKDINAFKMALLERWKAIITDNTIADLAAHTERQDRLAEIMRRAFSLDDCLEQAVRRWSFQSKAVRHAVAAVDDVRIDYLKALLVDAGLSESAASARSVFIYSASLGRSQIGNDPTARLTDSEISTIAQLLKTNLD